MMVDRLEERWRVTKGRPTMGNVITIRDYYERKADRLLRLMQNSDSPEYKIRLAVEYSQLQAKISQIDRLKFQENIRRMSGN